MKVFGNQIEYAANVITAHRHVAVAGVRKPGEFDPIALAKDMTKLVMQVIVSLLVLGICFVVLLKRPGEAVSNACFSAIGVVLGYWLR